MQTTPRTMLKAEPRRLVPGPRREDSRAGRWHRAGVGDPRRQRGRSKPLLAIGADVAVARPSLVRQPWPAPPARPGG